MAFRSSVRWRLLLAFLGISSFAVLGGIVAVYAFLQTETVLERIASRGVPTVLASLRLSRQAERLVAAAPALAAAASLDEHDEHAERIRAETDQLTALLDDLKRYDIAASVIEPIAFAVNWLTLNLISLETTVGNALAVGEQRKALVRDALDANTAMQLALQPAVDRLDDEIGKAETLASASTLDPQVRNTELAQAATSIVADWPLVPLSSDVAELGDRITLVASIDDRASLEALGEQLVVSLDRIDALAAPLEVAMRGLVSDHAEQFRAFVNGPKSVIRARMLELDARANARQLLAESSKASQQLTVAVDRLVSGAEESIRDAARQARREQRISTVVLAAVVALSFASSVLIVWLYVERHLIRRLTSLSGSMLAISHGQLDTTIPAGGNDEIASMADALRVFRATTADRAAAERARANLSRYFSPNLADHLAESPESLEFGGERREMSFLFSDLAGFTPLVEKLDPTVVVSVMNAYIDGIARICFEAGGTVDTVVGDAVHAIFGAPIAQPDHAARAVACALAIDRFATAFQAQMATDGIPVGITRIGVHTGSAIVGDFGGKNYFHYTAHGDAVNTTSRLETANKALGTRVCVSANTVAQIPAFVGRPIGELILKGKANPIGAFEPVAENEAESEQLAAYLSAFDKLKTGDPGCLRAFAAYIGEYDNEPLASFHLQRLLGGLLSTKIKLDGE